MLVPEVLLGSDAATILVRRVLGIIYLSNSSLRWATGDDVARETYPRVARGCGTGSGADVQGGERREKGTRGGAVPPERNQLP